MRGKNHKLKTENIQSWMKTKKTKRKGQKNIHTMGKHPRMNEKPKK
jgi:hypothetical protein